MGKDYFVYIMTDEYNRVLYTGVTNNLVRRAGEHQAWHGSYFARRYRVSKRVYYEVYGDISLAIAREKQIKGGSPQKKIDLINSLNPTWRDLYEDFVA